MLFLPQCFFGILAYEHKVPWQQLLEDLFQRPWEISVVLSGWLLRAWGGSTLLAFLVTAEARPRDSCLLPFHANK